MFPGVWASRHDLLAPLPACLSLRFTTQHPSLGAAPRGSPAFDLFTPHPSRLDSTRLDSAHASTLRRWRYRTLPSCTWPFPSSASFVFFSFSYFKRAVGIPFVVRTRAQCTKKALIFLFPLFGRGVLGDIGVGRATHLGVSLPFLLSTTAPSCSIGPPAWCYSGSQSRVLLAPIRFSPLQSTFVPPGFVAGDQSSNLHSATATLFPPLLHACYIPWASFSLSLRRRMDGLDGDDMNSRYGSSYGLYGWPTHFIALSLARCVCVCV